MGSRRLLQAGLGAAAVSVAALGVLVAAAFRPTAVLVVGGRHHRVPLPVPSFRVGSSPDGATFVALGDAELAPTLVARGRPLGWGPAEQMGAMMILPSTSEPGLRLFATWQQVASRFVRLDLRLVGPGAGGPPPSTPP